MQCPSCSAVVREAAKFCSKCGTALPRSCRSCGATNLADDQFCSECGTSLEATSSPASSRPAPTVGPSTRSQSKKSVHAERRQITVMFCDMVGSTALSTRLDPEEQGEVISAFLACCTNEIKLFGGMVAKYLGDGVLAYFGYPVAHEDDAERAVRSGLAVLRAVGALQAAPGLTLQARIGIATGVVVVGDLARGGITQENAAIGETTNLAARLQSLAEPNTMVIAPDTHRLVAALFEYRDLGQCSLKGFAEPVHARQVLRASNVENRFEARQSAGASPLLGREEELELLVRRWEQAKRGEGRVVLVSGEAGIGKSRLTRALQERLARDPHTRLIYHCSPYHRDSALHPIIGQLVRAAGIEFGDEAEVKLDKLATLLGGSIEPSGEDVALFAALLSIPGGNRYVLPSLTPQQLKERTLGAMVKQLRQLCIRQPVLMVFEDVHWIDPTSLELLSRLVDQTPSMQVLLLATARPEFVSPWPTHRHVTNVGLSRLDRIEGQALVAGVTGGKTLPAEVLDQIVAHTDGVPLFIEELTKTILESGVLRDAGNRYELTGPLPAVAIPSTLHASLLARLDRLASVKDVAQIGATIGREFSYRLISAVSEIADAKLRDVLGQLVAAELIFQRGEPPDATFTFKHALVQDAAYASLVRSRRQQLHAQIARSLEAEFPDIVAAEPELLAQHYTAAELAAQALPYWRRAGQRAIERSANLEAIVHLSKGLELLEALPEGTSRWQQELDFQLLLGPVLMYVKGVSAPDVGRTYARASELCQHVGDFSQKFAALWGSWYFHNGCGELHASREKAEELLRLARGNQDVAFRIMAHRTLCNTLHHLGELAASRAHMEHVIEYYEPTQHHSLALRYGQDPAVSARLFGALALWLLGYPDTALERMQEAQRLASEIAHPPSFALALCFAAVLHRLRREPATALERADAAIALSIEQGFGLYAAWATAVRGWALSHLGRAAEGCEQVRSGLSGMRTSGLRAVIPQHLASLAEALALAEQVPEGLQALDEALTIVNDSGDRNYEAELYRLKGELLLQHRNGNAEQAEANFRKAISIAREQSAKSLELRSAMSLARLWRDQDKPIEGHDLLAPVYGCFTEGFDTPDLKEAKVLLDQLGV